MLEPIQTKECQLTFNLDSELQIPEGPYFAGQMDSKLPQVVL